MRQITLTPNRYGDPGHFDGVEVVNIPGRGRFMIGYVSPEGTSRRVYMGPMLPGPYAYAYGLSVVIDNHGGSGAESARNLEAGTEFIAAIGDVITIDSRPYRITPTANRNIELEAVEVAA